MNTPLALTQLAQDALGLTKSQSNFFSALGEVGGSIPQAAALLPGMAKNLEQGLNALQGAGLLTWKGDVVDLSPAETTLRTLWDGEQIELGPEPVKTLRPLSQRLIGMVRTAKTPVAGLGAVYCFLFGGELLREQWSTVAAYIKQSGGAEAAAVFFLEHISDGLRNPLKELLPLFIASRTPYRPDTAPTDQELQAQQWALFEGGWRARMIANTPTEYDVSVWVSLGKPALDI